MQRNLAVQCMSAKVCSIRISNPRSLYVPVLHRSSQVATQPTQCSRRFFSVFNRKVVSPICLIPQTLPILLACKGLALASQRSSSAFHPLRSHGGKKAVKIAALPCKTTFARRSRAIHRQLTVRFHYHGQGGRRFITINNTTTTLLSSSRAGSHSFLSLVEVTKADKVD